MQVTALHRDFGLEVSGCRLRELDESGLFPEIRDLFERHSLLLFRDQHLDDREHLALGRRFGPLEDRVIGRAEPEICFVTNEGEERLYTQADWQLLHLQANFLWHTDSTFLPVPALANLLQARVVPGAGGETEFVSSRAGWRDLDPALKAKIGDRALWHSYGHSRAQIDPALAKQELIAQWPDQCWRAVIANPVTGAESLYIASHARAVEGMEPAAGSALIRAVMEAITRPEAVYSHRWRPGDLLIWDERAVLHRGRPWNYEEPRRLASICVSLTDADGLEAMRWAPGVPGSCRPSS